VRQRVRIRFAKEGEIKFISHHDLMRLFERALRRAELPVGMSEGFNPRPRVSFPLALAVGIEGREEIVEIELHEWVRPDEVREKLQRQLPSGVRLRDIRIVAASERAQVKEVTYEIHGPEEALPSEERIRDLLAREEIIVERVRKTTKTKRVNIRPYIRCIRRSAGRIDLALRVTPTGTARVDELMAVLTSTQRAARLHGVSICRTSVRIEPETWKKKGHQWQ